MQHFRMKLDGIQTARGILRRRHRAIRGMRHLTKTGRQPLDVVKMAHPALRKHGILCMILQDLSDPRILRVFFFITVIIRDLGSFRPHTRKKPGSRIHIDQGLAVLPHRSFGDFTPQHMLHQLRAVAKPQHGDPHGKKLRRTAGRSFLVAAVGAAGQNDALRLHGANLFEIRFVGIDLAIYIAFPHAACHQLIVLTTKIYDNDFFVFHLRSFS